MAYGSISLEKRLKDNIRNYSLKTLFDLDAIREQAENLYKMCGLSIVLTDRHGEKNISFGDFTAFHPDVVGDPGRKIRVANRTIAHLYVKYDQVEEKNRSIVEHLLEGIVCVYEALGEKSYYAKELSVYTDELEAKLEKESYQVMHGERLDELTGVQNRTYFDSRLKVLDRAQVAPVCAVCININDWKYANDHYGDEESDRLIQIVADILKQEAKPDYIIGRVDGDVFNVLIPMPEDEEGQNYCSRVKEACDTYEDAILAPSVAIGMVLKENVEESLSSLLSDAEYEMFEDKFRVKNASGYRERMEKGLQRGN